MSRPAIFYFDSSRGRRLLHARSRIQDAVAPRNASKFAPSLDPEACRGKWFLPTSEITAKLQNLEEDMHNAWREVELGASTSSYLSNKAIYLRQLFDHFLYGLNRQATKQKKRASFMKPIRLYKIDDPHMLNALRNQAEGRPYSEGALHAKCLESRRQARIAMAASSKTHPATQCVSQDPSHDWDDDKSITSISSYGSSGYQGSQDSVGTGRSGASSPEPTVPNYEYPMIKSYHGHSLANQRSLVKPFLDLGSTEAETEGTGTLKNGLPGREVRAISDDEDAETVERIIFESEDVEPLPNSRDISQKMNIFEPDSRGSAGDHSTAPQALIPTNQVDLAQAWDSVFPELRAVLQNIPIASASNIFDMLGSDLGSSYWTARRDRALSLLEQMEGAFQDAQAVILTPQANQSSLQKPRRSQKAT
ncbi:hypothetical protein M407DRAFT_30436 [Tulasnella calospora MUT 4182]|uniref:Uncharacterized protein n=1 Tax=Tulasnella calospora MUT 4182 TaxID=1051891 RepID=A0A0C3LEP3_9AGAM|nr:hypothetical protein M407DRAFT_30436 [Tulasnella calospora MUT 4182]